MFSKSCEYAIRAAVFIAGQSLTGHRCSIGDVAKETGAPEAFTGKILQTLSREGIIQSMKGPGGGFYIQPTQAKKITLSKIVDLIDGDSVYSGCAIGLRKCNEANPCPLHDQFKNIRSELKNMLENTNLFDLAQNVEKGRGMLKS